MIPFTVCATRLPAGSYWYVSARAGTGPPGAGATATVATFVYADRLPSGGVPVVFMHVFAEAVLPADVSPRSRPSASTA